MRADQSKEAWDVITSIQNAWESRDSLDFPNYAPAGSWGGPEDAEALIARQGHVWSSECTPKDKKSNIAIQVFKAQKEQNLAAAQLFI